MYLAVRPTSGRVSILGQEVGDAPRRALPPLRRRIGVVFQDFRLLPHLSAFDNVALPLRLAGRPEGQIRADVQEMLRWVGLIDKLGARPPQLSGGEQQRVAIARAVVGRPSLLLADEPTGNLDDEQARRLMQLLQEMNRIGTTVVVATHNDGLVARHVARALRLERGRLVGRLRCLGCCFVAARCCGPPGFDELGLRRALSDRLLPFLVAAMAFLAALALAGAVGAVRARAALARRRWRVAHGAGAAPGCACAGEPACAASRRADRAAGRSGRRVGARAHGRGADRAAPPMARRRHRAALTAFARRDTGALVGCFGERGWARAAARIRLLLAP